MTVIEVLEKYQKQLDPEGIEVGVSRQALDELIELYKAADTALAEKDIDIGRLEMQNSDLAGHILGMTCNMCNNRERADCFDKKTELEQDNAEKDKELARLNAAFDGYKYDSPAG